MAAEERELAAPEPAPAEPTAIRARRRRRRIRGVIVALAVVAAALVAFVVTGANGPAPLPPAPKFRLSELGGSGSLSFPSGPYAHHPVVLVFFASWCSPCQTEMPRLAREVRSLQAQHTPVRFLGIDGNDTPSKGLAFARRVGLSFPAVEDQQESVAYQLGLTGLPDTVFIGANGKVVHVVVGAVSSATLRHWVSALAATAQHPA